MRILVLEDDPDLQKLLTSVLNEAGHEVSNCTHGVSALATLMRQSHDLALCDLGLPSIDGLESIEFLRGRAPDLPIIVISARDRATWETRCQDAGATTYFQKPLDIPRLLQEVEMVAQVTRPLRVGVLDPDFYHRERLVQDFKNLRCQVTAWETGKEMLQAFEDDKEIQAPDLLLIDPNSRFRSEAAQWAQTRGVATVAINSPEGAGEDQLLREGFAMCVTKPVDGSKLLDQARFLTGGW